MRVIGHEAGKDGEIHMQAGREARDAEVSTENYLNHLLAAEQG